MRVDGRVAGGAGEVLVVSIGNMDPGTRVAVLLGQAKVDDKQLVAVSTNSHQEAENEMHQIVIKIDKRKVMRKNLSGLMSR